MSQGVAVPRPVNEPVLGYLPQSPERAALEAELARQSSEVVEIPIVIGGREVRTGKLAEVRCPHDHGKVLARYHESTPEIVEQAVAAAAEAWHTWSELRHPRPRQPLPADRRPARRGAPRAAERGHHAGPVEDLPPGRD